MQKGDLGGRVVILTELVIGLKHPFERDAGEGEVFLLV